MNPCILDSSMELLWFASYAFEHSSSFKPDLCCHFIQHMQYLSIPVRNVVLDTSSMRIFVIRSHICKESTLMNL